MLKTVSIFALTLTFPVVACTQSVQMAQVSAPVGAANPNPAAPSATQARGPSTLLKTFAAGTKGTIISTYTLNPDCTLRAYPTVQVTQQPVHGVVEVVHGEDYPSYPTQNPRSSCNKVKSPMTIVYYTPVAGFTGQDFLSIEEILNDGRDGHANFAITVK